MATETIEAEMLQELFKQTHTESHMDGDPLADDMGGRAGRVHDWRSYVPAEMKEMWPRLSIETRMAVAIVTAPAAANEIWD